MLISLLLLMRWGANMVCLFHVTIMGLAGLLLLDVQILWGTRFLQFLGFAVRVCEGFWLVIIMILVFKLILGIFVSVSGSAVSRQAAISLRAEFFAPEIGISPESGRPPVILSLSMGWSYSAPRGRGKARMRSFAGRAADTLK